MEVMLKQEEIIIGLLNTEVEELMEKAKELYAAAEAGVDTNIKTQEDLNRQAIGLAQRERMVAAREEELREKEEEVASTLERRRSELSSHEVDFNTHETALDADRKSLGD
jgi:leucyl aminopeptidase (aminopeptidase T)